MVRLSFRQLGWELYKTFMHTRAHHALSLLLSLSFSLSSSLLHKTHAHEHPLRTTVPPQSFRLVVCGQDMRLYLVVYTSASKADGAAENTFRPFSEIAYTTTSYN